MGAERQEDGSSGPEPVGAQPGGRGQGQVLASFSNYQFAICILFGTFENLKDFIVPNYSSIPSKALLADSRLARIL